MILENLDNDERRRNSHQEINDNVYVRFEKCALNASWSHTLSRAREKETLMRFLCTLLMSKCRTAHDHVLESTTCSYTEGPTLC